MNKANKIYHWSFRIFLVLFLIATLCNMKFNIIALKLTDKEYITILINIFILMALSYIPNLMKALRLQVPNSIYAILLTIDILSLLLGGVFRFYKLIPFWDSLLHLFSPIFFGLLGFALLNVFNDKKSALTLSPFFLMFYVFLFATATGTIWEIIEFTIDITTGANMQRYMTMDNEIKIGQVALLDTMKDIILNTIGAIISSIIAYVGAKKQSNFIKNLEIKYIPKQKLQEIETEELPANILAIEEESLLATNVVEQLASE